MAPRGGLQARRRVRGHELVVLQQPRGQGPRAAGAALVREEQHLAAQIELTIRSLAATGQPLAAAVAQQAVAARETLWRLELGDP